MYAITSIPQSLITTRGVEQPCYGSVSLTSFVTTPPQFLKPFGALPQVAGLFINIRPILHIITMNLLLAIHRLKSVVKPTASQAIRPAPDVEIISRAMESVVSTPRREQNFQR